jgi:hypothetical protein
MNFDRRKRKEKEKKLLVANHFTPAISCCPKSRRRHDTSSTSIKDGL